ncbi:c-type cytochrome biogenesis protein CcmI [Sulfitobacter sabulilitoris]|uniref:C-type cytochrome biogenesis protein CcmI n=1 Tax=Sulfitobacter sabulilitoris TaxID=2562655 RepID=A0A5S3PIT4_9RHOB|nr:c-type cytochrome biogenesis protein CcmI [Sulfitobacter sabulilitoris]TMM54237.1 c-type cytochrome biogenesis protein CcmI [Sulfitobacter sabulilitoris]
MAFWILTGLLALVVSGLLALSLARSRAQAADDRSPAAYDVDVYRDQLREVERDLERGVVSRADADRARTEVSRRLLAADAEVRAAPETEADGSRTTAVLAGLLVAGMVAGSFALYLRLGAPGYGDLALAQRIEMAETLRRERPGQSEAEASLPDAQVPGDASPDYIALVEQLRATVAARPDDLQGHLLLAQSEANLGNYAAAARAQQAVLRIKGAQASVDEMIDYADMLIIAAGGYVSPEAEAVLRAALARDGTNGTARYYMGLMLAQTGRPDTAFRLWDQLLREGPEDAPWIAPILNQIEEMALRAGVRYQLPEIGVAAGRGPDAADIEAAQDMTPAQRMEMIEGMVGRLSERLATQGGPAEDWAQLIGALGVLGETGRARAVYDNAVEVFAGDETALDLMRRAGQRARVVE